MAWTHVPCEQLTYEGEGLGWSRCDHGPTKMVTFPRTPPMWLCEAHEQEATTVRNRILAKARGT